MGLIYPNLPISIQSFSPYLPSPQLGALSELSPLCVLGTELSAWGGTELSGLPLELQGRSPAAASAHADSSPIWARLGDDRRWPPRPRWLSCHTGLQGLGVRVPQVGGSCHCRRLDCTSWKQRQGLQSILGTVVQAWMAWTQAEAAVDPGKCSCLRPRSPCGRGAYWELSCGGLSAREARRPRWVLGSRAV